MHRNSAATVSGPVLVIGSGLLGASVGLGLSVQGVETWVSDISPTTEAVAADIGAGRSLARLVEQVGPESARADIDPQLVVVATPPDVAAHTVAQALEDYPQAAVVDIASVKEPVLLALRETGADLSRYIGTHPMSGREKSGPVAARGELFMSRPWVICEHDDVAPETVRLARGLATDLGANVATMDVQEHDATVALISHVPQVMSSLLASRLRETPLESLSLAGQGLRDTTRIAASDPGLWVQILSANARPVVETLYGVREDLNRLIATLERPTADGARLDIAELMTEGNDGVARIPGKHGGAPKAFSALTVLVDDTPGQIARLLAEVGEIGVNVEDMRMEHSQGQPVGMVEISVVPTARDGLVHELTERGWKIAE
ncbi:prephenate dehydrogenase [Kocuria koreensis]|jgi:prephenate dehydrogenase|uniref:Prephenate dehydrogenase n=1 Tax=Rothia koreensis TaxID=592378 RepID=A0A7K1LHC4_9MICC|nr:prephenate dehydrogenase [Rothia koreensis]MUN54591.1 prephenate dehydrogenase [Rothia koreensis]